MTRDVDTINPNIEDGGGGGMGYVKKIKIDKLILLITISKKRLFAMNNISKNVNNNLLILSIAEVNNFLFN